eukprot:TRINITY_DN731_c0_g1_i1.p1 TRINITY_DN731_c0_g1~~TRINITY_DN731_c0_g1_i1.p1  ORF type:complete len:190 (+),score=36.04 TRINITY_DN731_c0_g1_i1:444-1013(+)
MPNQKCAVCGKTAYPLESLTAVDKSFHKGCFKCTVCNQTLNLKNFKGFDGQIYCATHTPKVKATAVTDSVATKAALAAPKKESGVRGIHKADPKVAPQNSGDFSVNQSGADQSTENAPESSSISYESHNADQSTENAPENSNISYDSYNADQSTENNPDDSHVQYETYNADQSTEGYGNTTYEDQGYEQ